MRELLRRAATAALSTRGLLVATAGAAAAGLAFLGGGGGSVHRVTARFADADGLVAGNDLLAHGVTAGSIDSVTVGTDASTGRPYAEVKLTIDSAYWPLHQGTRFAVRPRGVLSNVFVQLDPGPDSAPTVPGSHLFGVGETSSPVGLDQVADIFDADVRTALRTGLQEGPVALGGAGASNLNATIAQLDPLTDALVPLTGLLAQRSPELDRLNAEYDTITQKLSSEDASLGRLINEGDITLGALAARQHELQGTLDHAAGTLGSLDAGLHGEQSNLQALLQKGPETLDRLQQAASVLSPLIAAVDPHIPHLDILLDEFVSATGYQINGIDTLRVDAVLGLPGHSAQPCGGQHTPTSQEQRGCPYTPSYNLGAATSGPAGADQTDSGAGGGGDGGVFDLAGIFG